jgi:hypothetical protein
VLFFAAVVLAVAFLAGVLVVFVPDDAGDVVFLAVLVFFAAEEVDFVAGAFLAVDFEAADFEAVDFEAVDFEAADFVAGAFFAVDVVADFLAAVFAAVFVAVDRVPVDLVAVFLAVDFEAVDFAVVADVLAFLAGAFFAVVGVALAVGVAFAVERPPGVARFAADFAVPAATTATARTDGGFGIVAAVSLGSFLAPETTFLRSWPGENFGTDFFFDFIRSPVCGFRTQRALRTAFSNEPKPVMATFSPLATSRVIVSSTESSACAACFRFPS